MENTLAPQDAAPMSDTAALCVDSRASRDFGGRGWVASDLIEGLGHHVFAEDGPLVLAHPQQDLDVPFRRTNTRTPVGGGWFSPGWEKKFVATRQIAWFHRFLPIDRVHSSGKCSQITTLLPPLKKTPFFLSRKNGHHFVVPSAADAEWLQKNYGIPEHQVTVIRPSCRRAVLESGVFIPNAERGVVVVRDGRKDGFERHVSVIRRNFPHTRLVTVDLRDAQATAPEAWLRTLRNAQICFYLVDRPFDWATLALEAAYRNIPLVFADTNRTLREAIASPSLRLHSFMAEPPILSQLENAMEPVRGELDARGYFNPNQQAIAYRELYMDLGALGLG